VIDLQDRKELFQEASDLKEQWKGLLGDAYQYSFPKRENFFSESTEIEGEEKVEQIFDATAVDALVNMAARTMAILMPPFQNWFTFIPGWEIPEELQEDAQAQNQQNTEIFFRYFNISNFYFNFFSSLKEAGISVGVLRIREGDDNKPFSFLAIPFSNVFIQEGPTGDIENVWYRYKTSVRNIKRTWPNANLPGRFHNVQNSNEKITIFEGCIFDPSEPEGSQWLYYITTEDHSEVIFEEFRDWSCFLPFRFDVDPGEVMGRGPILTALPFIRDANKIAEFELISAKFRAFPMYTVPNSGIINPFTVILEPGSVIPVEPGQGPGLTPIPNSGDPQFVQLILGEIQQNIQSIMNINQLGSITGPTKSATEINLRQQDSQQVSLSLDARLINELAFKLISTVTKILIKRGFIQKFKIDHKLVGIKYNTPILNTQDTQDVQNTLTYINQLQSFQGETGISFNIDMVNIGGWLAEKQNIDSEVLSNSGDKAQKAQAFLQSFTQQAAPQQQQQIPSPGGAQQPPPQAGDTSTIPTSLIQGQ